MLEWFVLKLSCNVFSLCSAFLLAGEKSKHHNNYMENENLFVTNMNQLDYSFHSVVFLEASVWSRIVS